MSSALVLFITIFALFVAAQSQLLEGDVCLTNGNTEYRCSHADRCVNQTSERTGCEKNTVCCVSQRTRRQSSDKAHLYCENVLRTCRPFYVGQTEAPLRVARQAFSNPQRFEKDEGVVQPDKHPYMAHISYGQRQKWSCGGTLISESYVLTPAHCAYHPALGPAKLVRLGGSPNSQEIEIEEIVVHPKYVDKEMYYDVALLKLSREASFEGTVMPACLYTMPRFPYEAIKAVAWAESTNEKHLNLNSLIEARLITQNTTICPSVSLIKGELPPVENMMCVRGGGEQICRGYPGSILVVRVGNRCLRSIVGMATLDRCSLPDLPVLYTRISQFIPWIQRIVWP